MMMDVPVAKGSQHGYDLAVVVAFANHNSFLAEDDTPMLIGWMLRTLRLVDCLFSNFVDIHFGVYARTALG